PRPTNLECGVGVVSQILVGLDQSLEIYSCVASILIAGRLRKAMTASSELPLCHRQECSLMGHAEVTTMSLSPDARRIVLWSLTKANCFSNRRDECALPGPCSSRMQTGSPTYERRFVNRVPTSSRFGRRNTGSTSP